MKEHYFDYAATTPVDKEVFKSLEPYLKEKYGNPSSIYSKGQEARLAVEEAREKIASLIDADPEEIIFTSCATESNNLALKGVAFQHELTRKLARNNTKNKPHIITSQIEHHSVLNTCKYLEQFGHKVTYLPVGEKGLVQLQDVKKAITNKTMLVSIMYANNEIGTVQSVAEIGKIIKAIRIKRQEKGNKTPLYFHTDAVQAIQYLPTNVNKLGVDLLSITGHKFYAPKGVGALYIRKGVKFLPQQSGGGQEKHRRAGTENVAGIVGMAKALELAQERKEKEVKRLKNLRDYLIEKVLKIPGTFLTGDREKRLPHIASFAFRGVEGESLLLKLNNYKIFASTGSACTSDSLEPSHVLLALGLKHEIAHGSLRVSLGRHTVKEDIDLLIKVLPGIVEELRKISSFKYGATNER